jgi:hypothetical protein
LEPCPEIVDSKPEISEQIHFQKLRSVMTVLVVLIFVSVSGCGFIDLRPIGYTSFPETAGTVLPSERSMVGIRFDTVMDTMETEKAFSISAGELQITGDLSWHGGDLFFVPLEGWQPGIRYMLNFTGTIFALDGRETRAELHVPFYAVSMAKLPYLVGFNPADGASTGINPDAGVFLELRFSVPMNRLTTEDALVIDGVGDRECHWSDDDTVLIIVPKRSLLPWVVYRWTLGGKALSREGAPLAREASASFITDEDRLLPEVTEVSPLARASVGTWWQRTGLPIEGGLGPDQAIGIFFNKAMDESAIHSIRFDPVLPGRYEWWTDRTSVFIPDKNPEPETVYTLTVASGAKDSSGLGMGKDYRLFFIADIPYLAVIALDSGGNRSGSVYKAPLIMPDGILRVSIRFSHDFSARAKADTVLALRLEPYFPGILSQPAFRSAYWMADTLFLEWEGARPGVYEQAHYYSLVLPGGRGGITDGGGSYLREDINFILEAVER